VPVAFITHLIVVATVNSPGSSEEQWWLAEGLLRLFADTDQALALALLPKPISFRKALFTRAAGHSIQPDSGSIKAATELLEGAERSSCLMYKMGIAGTQRADGTAGSCGFIFIRGLCLR
jgi:hypothetical protein